MASLRVSLGDNQAKQTDKTGAKAKVTDKADVKAKATVKGAAWSVAGHAKTRKAS